MHIGHEMHGLRDVAAHLPFDLDDIEQANRAFQHWRSTRLAEEKRLVDIWTYCYVRRYFLLKCAREEGLLVSDVEYLVAKAYRKIAINADTVDDPGRYAHWISKLCKNTFLNHVRTGRHALPLDENSPRIASEPVSTLSDFGVLSRALSSAVSRLPAFLRGIAHMRFIERRSYEEIGEVTGKPLPIVRSYTSKAAARFREDRNLRALVEQSEPVTESLTRAVTAEQTAPMEGGVEGQTPYPKRPPRRSARR